MGAMKKIENMEKNLENLSPDMFTFAEYDANAAERTGYSNYSYWASTWRVFTKNKVAMFFLDPADRSDGVYIYPALSSGPEEPHRGLLKRGDRKTGQKPAAQRRLLVWNQLHWPGLMGQDLERYTYLSVHRPGRGPLGCLYGYHHRLSLGLCEKAGCGDHGGLQCDPQHTELHYP